MNPEVLLLAFLSVIALPASQVVTLDCESLYISLSLTQLNNGGHVILCGQISQYNKDVPYPPPLSEEIHETLQSKNITRERFMVLNYMNKADAALCELSQWVKSGQIKVRRK